MYEKLPSNLNYHRGVSIAIVDSGVYEGHPDLKGTVTKSFNALNQDEPIIDDLGHGTAIAGIISSSIKAEALNLPNWDIYDVKVLSEEGLGEVSDIITGIEWAIKEEVDIINISFGLQNNSSALENTINKALDQGIIIVAAAGNALIVDYPAKYERVLSVTAINQNMERIGLSAIGKVDYAAPGYEVLTTDINGNYSLFTGTSFSTAFVTGFIALLKSTTEEDITQENVNKYLEFYTEDLGEEGYDGKFGHGLLIYK